MTSSLAAAPKATDMRTRTVRHLNDMLRTTFLGVNGKVCMTRGVCALTEELRSDVLTAVREFKNFTENNDPHGEHDCATFEVHGRKFIWKIDYYDRALKYGSKDPSDPSLTTRVLTIMCAEEY